MDPITLALTGQLPFVVLAAAVAAFPVSLVLLHLYRKSVLGLMARGTLPPGARAADAPTQPARTRDNDGCATWHSSAARVKFSVSETARK